MPFDRTQHCITHAHASYASQLQRGNAMACCTVGDSWAGISSERALDSASIPSAMVDVALLTASVQLSDVPICLLWPQQAEIGLVAEWILLKIGL